MSDTLHRAELEFLMLGTKLGEGMSRSVYVYKDPAHWGRMRSDHALAYLDDESQLVIKVEKPGGQYQNVQEWSVWEYVKAEPAMKKWFAPCVAISPCGLYLIQHRVEPIRKAEMPKFLPAFLQDVVRDNLGKYDGRVVCCDYGMGVAAVRTASRRMKRVRPQ